MPSSAAPVSRSALHEFVPIAGKWSLEGDCATYLGYEDASFKLGVALARQRAKAGVFRTTVELSDDSESAAKTFTNALAKHRHFDRETDPPCV